MELFEAIEKRRSIRAYSDEQVSEEQLQKVLEAGRLAPSWKNGQCWRYVVVSDPVLKKKLGEEVNFNPDRTSYEKAAYVLVLCADPADSGNRSGKPYYLVDAGIVLEHTVLAATALGLGTCWVGVFPEQAVKELLHIPDHIQVVALTPLGVPAQERNARPRKELSEIACLNAWGEPLQ
ncbi:nitroreductase family protein [Oscillospiraceae bacterium PP1C4]